MARTGERKLVGVTVANKIHPWVPDELEDWAHFTYSNPERNRMYFCAHCYRSPNLFNKYHVKYIYDVCIFIQFQTKLLENKYSMIL